MRSISVDMTEHKTAEEAFGSSEERFRSLIQNISDVITVYDADGTIRYLSPTIKQMLGYEPAERIGSTAFDLIHPSDVARTKGAFVEALRRPGLPITVEARVRHRDGSWRYIEAVGTNLLDDPDVKGIVLNSRDVTERKQAEEALKESERKYRSVVDNVKEAIFQTDAQGLWTFLNPAWTEITKFSVKESIRTNFLNYIHPDDRQRNQELFRPLIERKKDYCRYEIRYLTKDGGFRWVEVWARLTLSDDNTIIGTSGTLNDITERKQAEERLRQAEAKYRTLVERMPAVVYIQEIGSPDSAMYMSPQIEDLTGYSPEECKNPDLRWGMVHPEDRERMQSEDEQTGEPGEVFTTEYRVVRRDGRTVWVRNESVMIEEEAGESCYWQGFMLDITERKRAEERLHHQATHDLLTDLPNRRLFVYRLKQALRPTSRRSRHKKAAVVFMDLDGFKLVNDSLGHEIGDRLLVAVGERLRACLRSEDTLARFGGDEFAALVENVEDPADAVRVAERIIEAHRQPFVLLGQELFIKPSIGISLGEEARKASSPEDLLRRADIAMYQAKKEGLGYRIFEPAMHEQVLRRLKLKNELQRAIESEEFVIYYQPIIDLQSGEVWGMEALVRWQHPERGLLEPKEFILAAEESGLIIPIGERVLEEACEQTKDWQESYPRISPLMVCVNLSAIQLRQPDLASIVKRVLQETGLKASSLSLDITETVFVKALEGNTTAVEELKRLGVHVSIDDFGVGYSSLSYLKRLPANVLKVDRSFIWALGEDVKDTVILQMIVDLAHTFGMEVIAEGVESEAQAEQLKEMGCDLAQGYYFARPLPPKAVPEFFAR